MTVDARPVHIKIDRAACRACLAGVLTCCKVHITQRNIVQRPLATETRVVGTRATQSEEACFLNEMVLEKSWTLCFLITFKAILIK